MSKKKGKPAARKAPKKATRKSAARSRATASLTAAPGRTSQVTIFLFKTPTGNMIRTSPQHAFAGPGHIEWTVVNLIDGAEVPVTITWRGDGPWGKDPIDVRNWIRKNADGVTPGTYKYEVRALGAVEDPEVEFPEN